MNVTTVTQQQEKADVLSAINDDASVSLMKANLPRGAFRNNEAVVSELRAFQQYPQIDKAETKRLTGIVQEELRFFLKEKLLTPSVIERVITEQLSEKAYEQVVPFYQESREAFSRWKEESYKHAFGTNVGEGADTRWEEYLATLEATAESILSVIPKNDFGNLLPAMNFYMRDLSLFGDSARSPQDSGLQASYQSLIDTYKELFPEYERFEPKVLDMLREFGQMNENNQRSLATTLKVDTSALYDISSKVEQWEISASYKIDLFQERYEAVCRSEARYDEAHQACTTGNWPLAAKFAKDGVREFALPASDLTELFAAACTGLTRASRNFDPSSGFAFSTYAVWDIQKAISTAAKQIIEKVHIPKGVSQIISKIDSFEREYRKKNEDFPSEEVILSQLSEIASPDAIQNANEVRKRKAISLSDSSNHAVRDEIFSRGALDNSFERRDYQDTLRKAIPKALESLSVRDREIVVLRFGLSDSAQAREYSTDEIAQHYGLTRQRIHQIVKKGLLQLQSEDSLISLHEALEN